MCDVGNVRCVVKRGVVCGMWCGLMSRGYLSVGVNLNLIRVEASNWRVFVEHLGLVCGVGGDAVL